LVYLGKLGTPYGVGKIRKPEEFDCVFFGIHRKMAESLDALTRLSLERSIEAIVDAGNLILHKSTYLLIH
jgi:acyl transferase domain-containing protein